MKQIIKTAEKIMNEAKELTGWNFIGGVKGNNCTIRADLLNEADKQIKVIMEIKANDVLIKVMGVDESFDRKALETVQGKLQFPVEAHLVEGESFALMYHEPLGVLEHSVKGVMKEVITPMVNVIGEMLAE